MGAGDIWRVVQNGGPDAIFLLIIFSSLWLTGRIFDKRAVDYRDKQIEQRDAIIERKDQIIARNTEVFDQTMKTFREEIIPLLRDLTRDRGGRKV